MVVVFLRGGDGVVGGGGVGGLTGGRLGEIRDRQMVCCGRGVGWVVEE